MDYDDMNEEAQQVRLAYQDIRERINGKVF
jgi:hypothetical protein